MPASAPLDCDCCARRDARSCPPLRQLSVTDLRRSVEVADAPPRSGCLVPHDAETRLHDAYLDRRCRHSCRRLPLLCVVGGRLEQVLGLQRVRATRERHDDELVASGVGRRDHRRQLCDGAWNPLLCTPKQRHRQLLGLQRQRGVGQWHDGRLVGPGPGHRDHRRCRHHRGLEPLLCRGRRRHDQLLGIEYTRPAGQQHDSGLDNRRLRFGLVTFVQPGQRHSARHATRSAR
jgi:hypothetical protein